MLGITESARGRRACPVERVGLASAARSRGLRQAKPDAEQPSFRSEAQLTVMNSSYITVRAWMSRLSRRRLSLEKSTLRNSVLSFSKLCLL